MRYDLLVDAMFINDSGGKVLLDYLLNELEQTDNSIYYLLDLRIKNKVPYLKNTKNKVLFVKGSLYNRYKFYKTHKEIFSKVLCFADFPPVFKLRAQVYTYFHQELYLELPKDSSAYDRILIFLKKTILKMFFKNTDFWILQTNHIKDKFKSKFNIEENNLLVLPFFPQIPQANKTTIREKNTFVYVSNAPPHKNHKRLINSFCQFYEKYPSGKLIVTVHNDFTDLCNLIETKKRAGYPIHNIGFVDRQELSKIYSSCEFLIYPSLAESFGLAVAEGIEKGCKVIGSDLPYLHAICKPSLVFDPLDQESIEKAFHYAVNNSIESSKSLVSNNIEKVLELVKSS